MMSGSMENTLWVAFGFGAQAVFAMRFIWQWIVSERRKESVIPIGFWYFSLVGGLMLTVYAAYRDPVLVPGQAAGIVVYVRNLVLIHRSNKSGVLANSGGAADSAPSESRRAA